MPTHSSRLFFAIFPDRTAAVQIAGLGRNIHTELGLTGKLRAPEKFHLTLHYLGQYNEEPAAVINLARQAADQVKHDPVWIRLNAVGSFDKHGGPAPLVLRARPGTRRMRTLRSLRQKLSVEMSRVGLAWEGRFEPHVTLGYDRSVVPLRTVDTIEWQAARFVLVHSSVGQYHELAQWSLPPGGVSG